MVQWFRYRNDDGTTQVVPGTPGLLELFKDKITPCESDGSPLGSKKVDSPAVADEKPTPKAAPKAQPRGKSAKASVDELEELLSK